MRKLKLPLLFAIFAAFALPFAAHAATMSDGDFVEQATMGGLFEIQSSQLALNKAQDAKAKEFAQKMIDDHTKINDELKSKLPNTGAKDVVLPTNLDAKHSALLTQLQSATPENFDSLYEKVQVDGHNEAVKLFKGYLRHGKDATLKSFAGENLSTLKMHQNDAKKLQAGR